MPFHSYRRPSSIPLQPAIRPRFTSRHRPAPELPEPVVRLGALTYRDRDGIWWTVREEYVRHEATSASYLVFAAAGQSIRVRQYPAVWRSLSTAGLIALSTAT